MVLVLFTLYLMSYHLILSQITNHGLIIIFYSLKFRSSLKLRHIYIFQIHSFNIFAVKVPLYKLPILSYHTVAKRVDAQKYNKLSIIS